ncbi:MULTISPECIES: LysR family transcriptional regulator [Methylobacterium]|uniref:LysR family transcriptional regulator n=1 Tax=Methylobacterium TaxID=407 RepID=UPI0013EA017E|nr:LysR family transcriptional regulator [Methylobacterium sp. DB0501]NGM35791.1 LysR family transcriptional regulator [Methylobacterium sp. DB0501]
MDRLSGMEAFAKAVETGSFSAAGEALELSPQAVGKQVRLLEEHLGVRLIHRTTRRQSLTEAGRALYERVRIILAEVEAVEAVAASSQAVPRGRIRVNASVTFGAYDLARVLPAYLAAYPQVDVELTLSDRKVDLIEEGYEVVFRVGPPAESGLIARPLRPMDFTLCAAPSYLADRGAPRVPADLAQHECLGFAYMATGDQWRFVGPDGPEAVEVSYRLLVNNGQALLTAALAGLGLLLQPAALMRDAVAAGHLVPVLPAYRPVSRPMHLLYAPDRRITPKLRSFIDFALAHFADSARDAPV